MKGSQNFLFAVILFAFAAVSFSAASDTYITQNGAGGNTGADCSNAHSAAWFNSSANWGSGKIGPGTTVHLCGTFTGAPGSTMLTTQGSGASGSPVTILFEDGAVLTAPYWAGVNGAIFCQNSFITIDGGTNGKIVNTANGTALTYQQVSRGISGGKSCSNFTVKNVTVSNLYIHTEGSNDAQDDSTGISAAGNNVLISKNIVDHASADIGFGTCGQAHIEIADNKVSFSNHAISAGVWGTNCIIDDVQIHDNDLGGGAYLWDNPNNDYHHNAIMVFADSSGGNGCSITNLQIYNNYMHGIWSRDKNYGGSHTTAMIFIDDQTGCSIQGYKIFNNVMSLDAGDLYGTANGLIAQTQTGGASGNLIAHNVFMQNNGGNGICMMLNNQSNLTLQNNIFQACGYAPQMGGTLSGTIEDNLYYNTAGGWTLPGKQFMSFSQWQEAGMDAHGQNGNDPKLDANYKPQAGSPAINAGANLTKLGVELLDIDKSGSQRPPNGNWDVGVLEFAGGGAPPDPPGDLSAIVH